MGGYGSGRRFGAAGSRKTTVEESLVLNITQLHQQNVLRRGAMGVWGWIHKSGESAGSVNYRIERDTDGDLTLCLEYDRTIRGEKEPVRNPIPLVSTQPNFGGSRTWFVCPAYRNGKACGRRVGRLYLPPGARYFACRHCYELTYKVCQEHSSRMDFYRRNPAALDQAVDEFLQRGKVDWTALKLVMNRA